jgi:hypothetical protein
METRAILTKAIEVIGFLFAAFGGFLANIAPPEGQDASYAVGITSFLALIILLFASAIAKNLPVRKFKKIWLIAAAVFFCSALASAFWYKHNLDRLTFAFPPEAIKAQYIKGTEMTPEAKEFQERTKKSDSAVVAAFGGLSKREQVWPIESIQRARLILTVSYSVLVLSLASSIFSLTEGILRK